MGPDPLPNTLVRELEAAVRDAANEAVLQALGDVRTAIADLEAADRGARDELAAAAMALPERVGVLVDGVVRHALREEREVLALALANSPAAAAHQLDLVVSEHRPITEPGLGGALLDRVVEDWRRGLAEALTSALVPHAGTLAVVASRVEDVDRSLGAMGEAVAANGDRLAAVEDALHAQAGSLAAIAARLEAHSVASATPPGLAGIAGPNVVTHGRDELRDELIAKSVAERLRGALGAALPPPGAAPLDLSPLAAEIHAFAAKTEARAGANDIAMRAMRTHIKAAANAEREHGERLDAVARQIEGLGAMGSVARNVESMAGRLAFAVEALNGHVILIQKLRRSMGLQTMLAVMNVAAAMLVFIAVFLDRFWYLLM